MDTHRQAIQVVQNWCQEAQGLHWCQSQEAQGLPITVGLARLADWVAEALDEANRTAYGRGLRDGVGFQHCRPPEQMQLLVDLAQQANAAGIWLLRDIANPDLVYNPPGDDNGIVPMCLTINDARLLFIARFPAGDGGLSGIEFHPDQAEPVREEV